MLGIPLWLALHSLPIAAGVLLVAALGLAAAWWRGLVAVGQIVGAVLTFFAAVATFFTQPADQIAEKIIYGVVCIMFALSLGSAITSHRLNAKWEAREAAAAAKIEAAEKERDARISEDVHSNVVSQLSALQSRSDELQKQVDDYEAYRRAHPADAACVLSDDDLERLQMGPHRQPKAVNRSRLNPLKYLPRLPAPRRPGAAPGA